MFGGGQPDAMRHVRQSVSTANADGRRSRRPVVVVVDVTAVAAAAIGRPATTASVVVTVVVVIDLVDHTGPALGVANPSVERQVRAGPRLQGVFRRGRSDGHGKDRVPGKRSRQGYRGFKRKLNYRFVYEFPLGLWLSLDTFTYRMTIITFFYGVHWNRWDICFNSTNYYTFVRLILLYVHKIMRRNGFKHPKSPVS